MKQKSNVLEVILFTLIGNKSVFALHSGCWIKCYFLVFHLHFTDLRKSKCPAAYKEGTLKGRVLTLRDTPLAGANISLAESPYKILTRSQDNGYFVVDAFCFEKGKPILITRHGYVPQLVDVTSSKSALKVKMENAGMYLCMYVFACFSNGPAKREWRLPFSGKFQRFPGGTLVNI